MTTPVNLSITKEPEEVEKAEKEEISSPVNVAETATPSPTHAQKQEDDFFVSPKLKSASTASFRDVAMAIRDGLLDHHGTPFQDIVKASIQKKAIDQRSVSPPNAGGDIFSSSLYRPESSFIAQGASFSREKAEQAFMKLMENVRTAKGRKRTDSLEGSGYRVNDVIRDTIADADRDTDEEEEEEQQQDGSEVSSRTTPRKGRQVKDWREDDNSVTSPSVFFHGGDSLGVNNNRILDVIISQGKAAQTEEEIKWLLKHSELFCCLEEEDFEYVLQSTLRREYLQGELILGENVRVEHVYCVMWGEVNVFKMADDEDQKEQRFQASPNAAEARRRSRSRSKNIMELSLSLDNGEVEEPEGMPIVCTSLVPGQTFGVEGCVFGSNSKFSFRAGSVTRKTIVALVPIEVVYKALSRSARFAQAVGGFITSSFDVFGPVRKFCRYVFSPSTAQNEYLPLWMILDAYTKIHNVIHTKLYSKELDTGAWGYALNRLPSNLTTTFCFDLVHALPPFVATRMRIEARGADIHKSAAGSHKERNNITFITTKERRRCTWHLGMKGKTLVLLRDGFTDLLDFLTMLCVHIIESNKLRGRIQGMVHPPAIDVLDDYLRLRDNEEDQQIVVSPEVEHDRIKKILQGMPLSEDEQRGLFNNWKSDTLLRIYEIMMHREEYNVRVDPSVSRKFQTNPFHEWALNLRRHVMEKLGLDPSASLPDDVTIDIISSNTHCMKNLLGGFLRRYRDEVLEYVKKNEQRRLGRPEEWNNVDDMLYVALPAFVQNARPDLREELSESVDANGITVIQDTAMTGLQVDVIPVYRIDLDTIDETIRVSLKDQFENAQKGCNWNQISKSVNIPEAISKEMNNEGKEEMIQIKRKSKTAHHTDSSCSRQYRRKSHFILNMDFAFGAQAEGIARALFSAFGKRIRSVSVMGKAGGLKGKRGDIQLATHVLLSKSSLILEDNQDELRNCRNQDFTQERLQELAGPRVNIHHGKVLTVTGTMLQNVSLLRYYKYVWNCVGTEMEGSYFARVIEDFYRQGIAHPGLTTRFAYYTSDLPLAQSEAEEEMRRTHKVAGEALTLSAPMTPLEGTPPLYAIARGILEKVLMHSLV